MGKRTYHHELHITELDTTRGPAGRPQWDAAAARHHDELHRIDHRDERHRVRTRLHDIERGGDPELVD